MSSGSSLDRSPMSSLGCATLPNCGRQPDSRTGCAESTTAPNIRLPRCCLKSSAPGTADATVANGRMAVCGQQCKRHLVLLPHRGRRIPHIVAGVATPLGEPISAVIDGWCREVWRVHRKQISPRPPVTISEFCFPIAACATNMLFTIPMQASPTGDSTGSQARCLSYWWKTTRRSVSRRQN